ncbi:hypothetical protein [Blastopirellula marina]|uniref:Uncharacterized protein n=1 Tax=Blastopirellula marina TaxID=124 RepID=A0A2S8F247_9BACT|nr:hypothetical protein [Blastopirellula marina]PQO26241.1 hypothetical protein C5Y98_30805 [Blastopirellula marina]PTL40640.1 hypothetical protein C5Y97_30820 [Blastopirellula marina]
MGNRKRAREVLNRQEELDAIRRLLTDMADRLRAEFKRLPVVPSWFALKLAAADAQRGAAAPDGNRE